MDGGSILIITDKGDYFVNGSASTPPELDGAIFNGEPNEDRSNIITENIEQLIISLRKSIAILYKDSLKSQSNVDWFENLIARRK